MKYVLFNRDLLSYTYFILIRHFAQSWN